MKRVLLGSLLSCILVGQVFGADQIVSRVSPALQAQRDEFKEGLIHGMKSSVAGVILGIGAEEFHSSFCKGYAGDFRPAMVSGFAYNLIRPAVSNDSADFKLGQLCSIPASIVAVPVVALAIAAFGTICLAAYDLCPSPWSSPLTIDLNAVKRP